MKPSESGTAPRRGAALLWAPQGGQRGLGQHGCLPFCLHYLRVTVTQSPTNVMWPRQGEALNELCAATPFPAAGKWGRDMA